MTVFEYVQSHPNTTSSDIAKALHRRTPVVTGALSQLYTTDHIVKTGVRGGAPTYRVNDLSFGCSNPLTLMFNQLLQAVRREAAQ